MRLRPLDEEMLGLIEAFETLSIGCVRKLPPQGLSRPPQFQPSPDYRSKTETYWCRYCPREFYDVESYEAHVTQRRSANFLDAIPGEVLPSNKSPRPFKRLREARQQVPVLNACEPYYSADLSSWETARTNSLRARMKANQAAILVAMSFEDRRKIHQAKYVYPYS